MNNYLDDLRERRKKLVKKIDEIDTLIIAEKIRLEKEKENNEKRVEFERVSQRENKLCYDDDEW